MTVSHGLRAAPGGQGCGLGTNGPRPALPGLWSLALTSGSTGALSRGGGVRAPRGQCRPQGQGPHLEDIQHVLVTEQGHGDADLLVLRLVASWRDLRAQRRLLADQGPPDAAGS